MLTQREVHSFLAGVGIKPNDTVLVHTSMRALGEVEGGCDGLIDAFVSYLKDGLFIVPTHTWASVGPQNPIYDPRKSVPCIGALPTVAAFRGDGVRSLHPTHSVAAFGKRAAEFVRGEEFATSPCSAGGVWRRLYDEGAKILLIGVGLDRNTYIHAVDEILDLPGRLADPFPLTVTDHTGGEHALLFRAHGCTGSRNFENYRTPLEALGGMKNATLGSATVGIVDAGAMTEVITKLWERADYDLTAERREIPEEYWQGLVWQDGKLFSKGGSEHITRLINDAIKNGSRTATVRGNHIIDSAVAIPSDFTLILENCHLLQASGSYSNVFTNENCYTELGRTVGGTDKNISIIGRGEAIIDGGEYNGLSERTQLKGGLPPIWKNNQILFANVDGFRIEGIKCQNQRWWAINLLYCKNGYLGGIDLCSDDTAVDECGNEYHTLSQDRYEDIRVKNSDGIDLRVGCQNIVIENVTGFTEDDTVAVTGVPLKLEEHFRVEGLSTDIHGIKIRNIRAAAFCTIVRLLNQGGIKLYDVTVEDVHDTSDTTTKMDEGLYAVRIGDKHLYSTRHATADETYGIKIRGVHARGRCAIALAGDLCDLEISDINTYGSTKALLDERENIKGEQK